jgi:hypothetical protein
MLPELVPPRIILEGIESSPGAWQSEANVLGNIRVVHGRVPFDRRHRSKIDYIALRRAFPSGRD